MISITIAREEVFLEMLGIEEIKAEDTTSKNARFRNRCCKLSYIGTFCGQNNHDSQYFACQSLTVVFVNQIIQIQLLTNMTLNRKVTKPLHHYCKILLQISRSVTRYQCNSRQVTGLLKNKKLLKKYI